MRKLAIHLFFIIVALITVVSLAGAEDALLKPYVLASSVPGTINKKLADVKAAVGQQGFQVVGEYAPYKGAYVIVVSSDALKKSAAQSNFGAYGAIQRIALTEVGSNLQISYTNPLYMAQAYRMKDSLSDIAAGLEKALGKKTEYGAKDGIKASNLRKYHYMVMMPYFTDQVQLASYGSQEDALKTVEANLAARKGGTLKVFRVDLPNKKESVFGVGLSEGDGADSTVMKITDFGDPKQTAHLPYDIVVSNGTVYMLHGKFRIAASFPDLTMGTFMKISGAPSAIEEKLKLVAGGK
ncbi:MAG: hypothetical protein HZA11_07485 [Nitrospirae bacterium]|nr:hypothetical protein [Nitrospirota bacterium]